MRGTYWLIAAGVGAAVWASLGWLGGMNPADAKKLVSQARAQLKSSQPGVALETAAAILDDSPANVEALLIAGEAASRLNDFPLALSYYRDVPAETIEIISARMLK